MRKHLVVCFELGYTVEDMVGFYNSLVGVFGEGGCVERTKDGEVTSFKVDTDYGGLELDFEKKILRLGMRESGELSSEEIWVLYNTLKKALVIRSDKTWYIDVDYIFEVV